MAETEEPVCPIYNSKVFEQAAQTAEPHTNYILRKLGVYV